MDDLDAETANYIVTYYSQFLNLDEKVAIRHTHSLSKLSDVLNPNLEKMYKKQSWLTDSEAALSLLRNGHDAFEIGAATRILKDNNDKIFLNNCPECGKLARTPLAKQCRYCKHNWH